MKTETTNLLAKLTPEQAAILADHEPIMRVASNLQHRYGTATAMRYLKLEFRKLPRPKGIKSIQVDKQNKYQPKTKLRGEWLTLVIDGVEVRGIQTDRGWRCSISDLSLLLLPKAHYGWLDSSIVRDKYFYREVLRPQGFTGTRRRVICNKTTYVTISEPDTRLVILNRHDLGFGRS